MYYSLEVTCTTLLTTHVLNRLRQKEISGFTKPVTVIQMKSDRQASWKGRDAGTSK